jgi:L-seryl-tRNA(Ser) seleniumtransferase
MSILDLKNLPSVDQILSRTEIAPLLSTHPRKIILICVNEIIEKMREELIAWEGSAPTRDELVSELLGRLGDSLRAKIASTLVRVVNATGTIIHTNLGRSLLPQAALEALVNAASHYTTLEYDLARGERGSRYVHCEKILKELTGAEAALVVNNNAAAVLLALNTLSFGKETIISRGELVEIGGSFRMPEVMEKSGAVMVEVGSTNRTRLPDYEAALTKETALLAKVHRSNFLMVGFVEEVALADLAALGRARDIPVLHDLGSGLFVDLSKYGLGMEPLVKQSLEAGASVVTFSGDKLLGGPQAGIVLGKRETIERMKRNPLTRALRVDKFTIAALEATLRLYYDPEGALRSIPTIRMATESLDVLRERAGRIVADLGTERVGCIAMREGEATIGGGSFPGVTIATVELRISSSARKAHEIEALARGNNPPIIGRVQENTFILDMRTVRDEDLAPLKEFLAGILP